MHKFDKKIKSKKIIIKAIKINNNKNITNLLQNKNYIDNQKTIKYNKYIIYNKHKQKKGEKNTWTKQK